MSEDPGSNLEEWKETMQAEHEDAIANPDPDADHEIEGVSQISYRITFAYDAESDSLERVESVQVEELTDPELLSCVCGVRGMTREEAIEHVRAARQ